MRKFIDPRRGGTDKASEVEPIVVQYFTMIVEVKTKLSGRAAREMRTIAEALDLVIEGEPTKAADVLMQRFKAIEMAEQDGNWQVAKQLELAAASSGGAAGTKERAEAIKLAAKARKLENNPPGKAAGGGRGGGRGAHE